MTYKTSKDYERLWELVRRGNKIACFVDTRFDKEHVRAVTQASIENNYYTIGAPGICYSIGQCFARFKKRAASINLEFIDPDSQERTKVWHSPEEVPEEDRVVMFLNFGGKFLTGRYADGVFQPYFFLDDIVKWAYVSDLTDLE